MLLTIQKLEARIRELEKYRYRDNIKIEDVKFLLDSTALNGAKPPENGKWQDFSRADSWKSEDEYAWIKANIMIPEEWANRKVVARFKLTDRNTAFIEGVFVWGFEALLYLNGQVYQGVDTNHQEVFIPQELVGTNVEFDIRLWSGMRLSEYRLSIAEICCLDEAADDLYYSSLTILRTVKLLDQSSNERYMLLNALDDAFLELNWSRPGSEVFYTSISNACEVLKNKLSEIPKLSTVFIDCVGQTHLDLEWVWRLTHTKEKAARSFSTVLRLMEMFPEYLFMQSQPVLYQFMKEHYPDIYKQIKQAVHDGRWEPEGAMWVEPDCNLTSGESLVRQILHGKKFFRDEFGVDNTVLWLPDTFGFNAALPQIMKKSGIKYFSTGKMGCSNFNKMPNDLFWWEGLDGSKVLVHFRSTSDSVNNDYTESLKVHPELAVGAWRKYKNKELNNELLACYGYSDGGGGANREVFEMYRRLKDLPGIPQVRLSRMRDHFENLEKKINSTHKFVHTWNGEMYLEIHRGTYTSQAKIKRLNRKMELFYRETEFMCSLSGLLGNNWADYPAKSLDEGWKILLLKQFHDVLPGSSIDKVYEDSYKDYEKCEAIAQKEYLQASQNLIEDNSEKSFTVYNSSPWSYTGIAIANEFIGNSGGQWEDASGNTLEAVENGDEWLVHVKNIPPMGFGTIYYNCERNASEESVDASQNNYFSQTPSSMETPYYNIEWNEKGHLTRIFDKEHKREVLENDSCGNVLEVFEDKPVNWGAWDTDIFYLEKCDIVEKLLYATVIEVNKLRVVIRFNWEYSDSLIKQDMILYSNNRRIDFVTHVNWHEREKLLKSAFEVKVKATEATYDIPFGNIKRPTHWSTSWDYGKFEAYAHQWADLSENGYGVSLLNDCKYGYAIKDNVMRISLIKSGVNPSKSRDGLANICTVGNVINDQGEHFFTYSLLPHHGSWLEGNTVKEAWMLNNPPVCTKGKASHPLFSLFNIGGANVFIDCVKKAEADDAVILRIHEYAGGRENINITSDLKILSWQECDLLEQPIGDLNTTQAMNFHIQPYEIKTFLIRIES